MGVARLRKWEPGVLYCGWIKAPKDMRRWFRKQGLSAVMRYNQKEGCFEYCQGNAKTIRQLFRFAFASGLFIMSSFTAVDKNIKALPKESQPFWSFRFWHPSRAS